jgi:hypothetical protein
VAVVVVVVGGGGGVVGSVVGGGGTLPCLFVFALLQQLQIVLRALFFVL